MINKTTYTVSGIQVKNLALTQYVFFLQRRMLSGLTWNSHTHSDAFQVQRLPIIMMNNSFDNDIRLHGMNT